VTPADVPTPDACPRCAELATSLEEMTALRNEADHWLRRSNDHAMDETREKERLEAFIEQQTPGVGISRITITRFLTDTGRDVVSVEPVDSAGERLAVVEALGLLQLAIYDVCNSPAEDGDDD
jgi:hypothetical protein